MNLSPLAFDRLKTTMEAIKQQKIILDALNAQIPAIIKSDLGVDIEQGEWTLDIDTGEVVAGEEKQGEH